MSTREKEIRNAIDTIFPIPPYEKGRKYEQALMATGFEAGVQWADNHPKTHWISVEDDLPCNHKELISPDDKRYTVYVVAMIHGYIILSRMYKLDGKWSWENDEPTHWFPIPEPPKKQRDSANGYKNDKFDPKTLKPFDKILVRDSHNENWCAAYFSHIMYDLSEYDLNECEEKHEFIICTTGSSDFSYCIPYNDETKHLVGTTDEVPDNYRYWKN